MVQYAEQRVVDAAVGFLADASASSLETLKWAVLALDLAKTQPDIDDAFRRAREAFASLDG